MFACFFCCMCFIETCIMPTHPVADPSPLCRGIHAPPAQVRLQHDWCISNGPGSNDEMLCVLGGVAFAGAASAHVVGGASGLPIGGGMAAQTVTGALEWSVNACSMRTLETHHALTGVLRLAEDIPEDYVYFQVNRRRARAA